MSTFFPSDRAERPERVPKSNRQCDIGKAALRVVRAGYVQPSMTEPGKSIGAKGKVKTSLTVANSDSVKQ